MNHLTISAFAALSAIMVTTCAAAAEPGDNVKMTIERWREPGSNNIGTADLILANHNAFAVSSIKVKCHYVVKETGRTIETMQTLPMTLKPNSTRKFRKVRFAYIDVDAADGSCKIVSLAKK